MSAKYRIHDQAKSQATSLTSWGHLRPRFLILNNETGHAVDDAQSRYEARQALSLWNTGVLTEE
jgi:hypothetical protein